MLSNDFKKNWKRKQREFAERKGPSTTAVAKESTVATESAYLSLLAMGNEMIKLIVGVEGSEPTCTTFVVHKKLICQKIPYFKKMFADGWKESADNVATFPEDSIESFDILLGWVYTGVLRPLEKKDDVLNESKEVAFYTWNPINFYALAQKMCLPLLQDRTMDALISKHKNEVTLFSAGQILHIYGVTQPGCALQRYAALMVAHIILGPANVASGHWSITKLHETLKENDDLSLDVLKLMRGSHGGVLVDPRKSPICDFHEHKQHEPCFLT